MNRRIVLAGLCLLSLPAVAGCVDTNGSGGASSLDASIPTLDAGLFPDVGQPTPRDSGASDATDGAPGDDGGDAASGPTLVFPPGPDGGSAVVDFGLNDCGGAAPSPFTLTTANTGGTTAHYDLSLSATSVFQIVGATSGDVAPGASATITIAASAVPASATAGATDTATLTITTNDPQHPSVTALLTRTARGGTLSLSPATAAFGDIPVGSTANALPLTLTNTGNAPVSVTVASPTNADFALVGGPDAGALTLAASASQSYSATFAPSASGAETATSAIGVTGAVCGASASSIGFTGNGTKGVVAVTPGNVDFGLVSCGAAAGAKSVTVQNSGNASFTFNAKLLAGTSFTVLPTTGTVAPAGSATLTITPSKIPSVASTAANGFGDTLRITTNAVGDAPHDVALTETAQGAVLALDTTTIGFGNVVLQQTATSPFTITNTGNASATVTLTASAAPFGVSPTTATTLTGGGSPLAGSATFHPTTLGSAGGSVSIATAKADVLCSAPIGPIQLGGTGVNGVMTVSTTKIDFQSVPCGQAAGQQSFTIANTGTAPFSWSAALGKGASSPYALSPASGTIDPGAPATTVTVTPAKIPFPSALTANLYGDTITITPTGIAGGSPQTVTLTETAKGAVVTASAPPGFGNQQEGQTTAPATLTIQNVGTMGVTITPTITGANPTSFALTTPGATLVSPSSSYSPGPTFTPLATGALAAQVSLAKGANDVLCQPLPGPVALSGTGTNGAISLGAASITIAAQPCGASAGLTQALKLTNNGTAPLTWNAAILGTTGFSVTPMTGSLAAGGANVTLTVTGPTFSSNNNDVSPITDTLRVTTSAYGDGNHDVPLSSTPSGAILAWGQTGFAFGTVQATSNASVAKSLPLSVTNSGNVSATLTFATQSAGKTQYTFAPQNQAVAGGATLNGSAIFTPTVVSTQTDTALFTVANGTPLCAALPAGVPLSGSGAAGSYSTPATGLGFSLTCNAAPAPQAFTIGNFGAVAPSVVPYDFTASISGSGWTVSPTSGTVNPSKSVTLTVTPPAVSTGATPGTQNNVAVTITTDIPGDQPHLVSADGTVTGASLQFLDGAGAIQSTFAFNDQNGTASTNLNNGGNAAETVDYVVTPDPGNIDYPSVSALAVGWGGTANVGANTVTYTYTPPAGAKCSTPIKYTVTFPFTNNLLGICTGVSQVLQISNGLGC